MQLTNTAEKYGLIAKIFHWLMAVLIILTWGVGSYASDLSNTTPQKPQLFVLHKSVGMVILMLLIIRFSWSLYNRNPIIKGRKIFATTVKAVHYLLYLFMFIQPISGWLMSSAAGRAPTFFGLFTFPAIVVPNPSSIKLFANIHIIGSQILLLLFILHVSAAMFHHYVLKDNTIRRMTID